MTNFRSLCAELVEALENAIRVIYAEDGTKHISTADPVIAKADAALAEAYEAEANNPPEGHPDPEPFQAILRERAAALAQPEPQGPGPTDEDLLDMWMEQYGIGPAMMSHVEFRHAIRAVLARWGRPAVEPVPVAERPWEHEGWCDVDGQCWMGDGGGSGFVPSWRLCKPSDSSLAWSLPHWALPVPNFDSITQGE